MQNRWTTSDFEAATWLLLARWLSFRMSMVMPFWRELYLEHQRAVGDTCQSFKVKSFKAKHYFLLIIENSQTLVPNQNAASFLEIFFGADCQPQACSQATRLSRGLQSMLGVGGSVRQAWGFFGSWGMFLELEGSIRQDLLTTSLVFSLFQGWNSMGCVVEKFLW